MSIAASLQMNSLMIGRREKNGSIIRLDLKKTFGKTDFVFLDAVLCANFSS